MTLINTEGMSFIGPGSEWFWSALSGIILAVTFIAIYRQLRMQASGRAMEQLEAFERAASSEQSHRYALDILVALRDGADPAQIPNVAAMQIGGAWEKFALLARAGHLDIKLLWRWDSEGPQGWWLMLAPRARRRRSETGDQGILEDLEWLAGKMADMDRLAGRPLLSADDVAGNLNGWIGSHEAGLRDALALRTMYVAAPTDQPRGAAVVSGDVT